MRRRLALLCLLLVLPGGVVSAAPTQSLARARAEFERGEYKKVVATLTPEVSLLSDEADLKEAHYILGVSYFYTKNRDLARQEFTALLYLDPSHELDKLTESPEVYAFYDSLKREMQDKLEAIRLQREREEEAKRQPLREVVIERTVRESSAWGNFVPFGYGQFRNGQPAKGVFFLVAESLLGGTSIALFGHQAVTYGIPSHYPPDFSDADRSALRTRQIVQVGAGGLFLVTYIWGVIDAFTNQKPHVTETRSERPIAPAPAPTSRVPLITPVVGPEGVGLGATWRF